MEKENSLLKQELSLDGKDVEIKSETFEKLMFLYSAALKKVETEVDILKDEFKYLYNYTLIDHVTTRIKKPESILNKMKKHIKYNAKITNIDPHCKFIISYFDILYIKSFLVKYLQSL